MKFACGHPVLRDGPCVICRHREIVAAARPAKARDLAARFPKMAAPACSKRGVSLGLIDCAVCGLSGQRVEAFACSLHGRCTVDPLKRARGVRRCQGCPDAAA